MFFEENFFLVKVCFWSKIEKGKKNIFSGSSLVRALAMAAGDPGAIPGSTTNFSYFPN